MSVLHRYRSGQLVIDGILIAVSWWAAFQLRFERLPVFYEGYLEYWIFAAVVAVKLVVLALFGLYQPLVALRLAPRHVVVAARSSDRRPRRRRHSAALGSVRRPVAARHLPDRRNPPVRTSCRRPSANPDAVRASWSVGNRGPRQGGPDRRCRRRRQSDHQPGREEEREEKEKREKREKDAPRARGCATPPWLWSTTIRASRT